MGCSDFQADFSGPQARRWGTGAEMRFLVRMFDVKQMHGVDATPHVVEQGRSKAEQEGLTEKIPFTLAYACNSGLGNDCADFVWGEDAWCYVVDKEKLIAEASPLIRPGGAIAFTDWIEGH